MDTLYLTPDWDLTLDTSGNIALASNPHALAQDAASACRTFLGECWYDTTQGIAYWQDILGKMPPLELVRADLVAAALTVPGIASAQCFFSGLTNRQLTGQIQVTDANGVTSAAGF